MTIGRGNNLGKKEAAIKTYTCPLRLTNFLTLRGKSTLVLPLLLWMLVGSQPAPAQVINYPVGMLGSFTPEGLLLQQVLAGSPSEKVGLQPGDLILKINGQGIGNQLEFAALINTSGGAPILVVRKGGNSRIQRVVLDMTGANQGPLAPFILGVIGPFTPEGLRVQGVLPGTGAAWAGLEKGDTILRLNNVLLRSPLDLRSSLASSDGMGHLEVRKLNGRLVQIKTEFLPREFGGVGAFVRDGLLVAGVIPGSPADAIGLQRWDLISRIDNRHVTNARDLQAVLNESGGTIALLVKKRNGRPARFILDLVTNPLGAWFEPTGQGPRITGLLPGSPAQMSGLQQGDILGRVDDRPVRTPEELAAVLRGASNPATVVVRRAATGQISRLVINLAW